MQRLIQRHIPVSYTHLKETGQIISTRSGANPQRSFGADVLSRIDAAARADDNDKEMCIRDRGSGALRADSKGFKA